MSIQSVEAYAAVPRGDSLVRRIAAALVRWAVRLRETERIRAELSELTDRELGDMGLSRCQINYVANGTFSR